MDMPIEMQHQTMGYDRTATMFSPDGHLLQVEYAEKTVRLGSSSIGIICSDGVFIIADKRVEDKLIIPKSATKIYEVDSHIVISVAGIISDARILVEKGQVLAQQHKITYDSPVEPELITKEISDIKQQFTQYGGTRPFGVSLMLAGVIGKKPQLYTIDVTGNYFGYYANAIGENDDKIKERLREKYKSEMTIKEGIKIALEIFKEVQRDRFKLDRFEVSYITNDKGKLERLKGEEISEYSK